MVEDTTFTISIRPKSKTTTYRPKAVYFWAVHEVEQWFRRHCIEYNDLYGRVFEKHDITGQALIRMNDNTLMRLGITNAEHRQAIWREILKLRLKNDIMEIRDLETRSIYFNYNMMD